MDLKHREKSCVKFEHLQRIEDLKQLVDQEYQGSMTEQDRQQVRDICAKKAGDCLQSDMDFIDRLWNRLFSV